jgi:hypothetical protein
MRAISAASASSETMDAGDDAEIPVKVEEYNYAVFDLGREEPKIQAFSEFPLRPGGRAPSFALEDLDGAALVEMKELWAAGPAILEFGSFT